MPLGVSEDVGADEKLLHQLSGSMSRHACYGGLV